MRVKKIAMMLLMICVVCLGGCDKGNKEQEMTRDYLPGDYYEAEGTDEMVVEDNCGKD